MSTEATLRAKVKARNILGYAANDLFLGMRAIFNQYPTGTPVCKQDGTWLKKVEQQLPDEEVLWPKQDGVTIKYLRNRSQYSVGFTVTVGVYKGDDWIFEDATVYICDLQVQRTHGRWHESPRLRTDYSFDEITQLRGIHTKAKEAAALAHSHLWPFGE